MSVDATLGLRLFPVSDPADGMDTGGALAELVEGSWRYYPERPDDHVDAFERYLDDHFDDLGETRPASQAVYPTDDGDDAVAVVLDTLLFDILEDGIEYRYRVDVPHAQAICSEKTDDETGLSAERTVPDDRIGDGMQRSADALDHAVEWLAVISPRSFSGMVEASEDMIDPGDDDGV